MSAGGTGGRYEEQVVSEGNNPVRATTNPDRFSSKVLSLVTVCLLDLEGDCLLGTP